MNEVFDELLYRLANLRLKTVRTVATLGMIFGIMFLIFQYLIGYRTDFTLILLGVSLTAFIWCIVDVIGQIIDEF